MRNWIGVSLLVPACVVVVLTFLQPSTSIVPQTVGHASTRNAIQNTGSVQSRVRTANFATLAGESTAADMVESIRPELEVAYDRSFDSQGDEIEQMVRVVHRSGYASAKSAEVGYLRFVD